MRVANRLQGLAQSEIRRMTRECERVGGINLGQGICDLPTHPLVRDGAIAAIRDNRSTYSFPEGAVTLRRAIAAKVERENGIHADPETEIIVTLGATVGVLDERTVTIMGLSKTFSITGWRLGYAVARAELVRPIALVNDVYYVCAPTPLQLGAAAGFDAPATYFESLRSSYQNKRDM